MIRTVKDLIYELNQIENKDLPIFAYHPHEDIIQIIDIDTSIDDRVDLNLKWE